MSVQIPIEIKDAAQQVHDGHESMVPVRTLLSWFNAERRGYWKVREIRKALTKLKLKTEPDFEGVWIGAVVSLVARSKAISKTSSKVTAASAENPVSAGPVAVEDATPVPGKVGDPVNRIERLASANRPPTFVPPDATVKEATTIMLLNDWAQLPVMTSDREVKGMFSWKSLGSRLALGNHCNHVRDCMDPYYEISVNAPLFEAIHSIVEHDCVLVRALDRKVCGIVTTADLSMQFAQLGEPFLLLGQIENHIRAVVADKFTKSELIKARDPADSARTVEDVADLTLGECCRLLEDPKRWNKVGIAIDRKGFIQDLEAVRTIRNDVMHFDPDGPGEDNLKLLRRMVQFFQRLGQLSPKTPKAGDD